jgi:hypothetical protein
VAVLANDRHEAAARVRALGGSAEDAAAAAGYDIKASSFSSNARRLIQRADIRERIKELQAETASKATDITAEAIHKILWRIASKRLEDEEIKTSDVLAAAREIGKMLGFYAPDRGDENVGLTVVIKGGLPDTNDKPPDAES